MAKNKVSRNVLKVLREKIRPSVHVQNSKHNQSKDDSSEIPTEHTEEVVYLTREQRRQLFKQHVALPISAKRMQKQWREQVEKANKIREEEKGEA